MICIDGYYIFLLNFLHFFVDEADSFFIQILNTLINMTLQTIHFRIDIIQTLHHKRFNISQFINKIIRYKHIVISSKMVYLSRKFGFLVLFVLNFLVDVTLHSFSWFDPHFFYVYFQSVFDAVYRELQFFTAGLFAAFQGCLTLLFLQFKFSIDLFKIFTKVFQSFFYISRYFSYVFLCFR